MERVGRLVVTAIAAGLISGVIGCGSTGRGPDEVPAVPASGTVYYKGQPLAAGSVLTVPAQGHPAAGEIRDGKFVLTTYQTDDGAVPGEHKVAVIAIEEQKSKSGETATKSILPAKYSKAETSNVVIKIPAEGTGELKIEVE